MPPVYYQTANNEVYQIDERSQRILVYTHLHGEVLLADAVEPAGVENTKYMKARVESQLGPSGADLLRLEQSSQMRLDGSFSDDLFLSMTDEGEQFIRDHRENLSMPVEIAELSKRVAELQLEGDALASRLEDEEMLDRLAELLADRLEERLVDRINN